MKIENVSGERIISNNVEKKVGCKTNQTSNEWQSKVC
jgi:hypothetical protein